MTEQEADEFARQKLELAKTFLQSDAVPACKDTGDAAALPELYMVDSFRYDAKSVEDFRDYVLQRIAELDGELAKHIEDNDWFTDLFARIHDVLKETGEPITEPLSEGKHSRWRSLETRIYHLAARAERAESELAIARDLIESMRKEKQA